MKGPQTLAQGVGTGGIPDRRDAPPGEEGPSVRYVLLARFKKKKNARARAASPGFEPRSPRLHTAGCFIRQLRTASPIRRVSVLRPAERTFAFILVRRGARAYYPSPGAARLGNGAETRLEIFFFRSRGNLLGPPAAFGSRRLFVRGRQHSRLFVSRLSLCAYQSTKRLLLPPSTTRGRSRRGAREASALAGV